MKPRKHFVYGIHITDRMKSAVEVQKILTEFGCNIKTRLGLHDVGEDYCTSTGLLILELIGDEGKIQEMHTKLKAIEGVEVKGMIFDHPGEIKKQDTCET
jgi:hypothetical protein